MQCNIRFCVKIHFIFLKIVIEKHCINGDSIKNLFFFSLSNAYLSINAQISSKAPLSLPSSLRLSRGARSLSSLLLLISRYTRHIYAKSARARVRPLMTFLAPVFFFRRNSIRYYLRVRGEKNSYISVHVHKTRSRTCPWPEEAGSGTRRRIRSRMRFSLCARKSEREKDPRAIAYRAIFHGARARDVDDSLGKLYF